jgi:hypothetical protein
MTCVISVRALFLIPIISNISGYYAHSSSFVMLDMLCVDNVCTFDEPYQRNLLLFDATFPQKICMCIIFFIMIVVDD